MIKLIDLVVFVVAGVTIWQIFIPVFMGLPIFPLLRSKRQHTLMELIARARQDQAEEKLSGGATGNGGISFMDLMSAKTMRDLSLDITVPRGNQRK